MLGDPRTLMCSARRYIRFFVVSTILLSLTAVAFLTAEIIVLTIQIALSEYKSAESKERQLMKHQRVLSRFEELGRKVDRRNYQEVIESYANQGQTVVPFTSPPQWRYGAPVPLGGLSNTLVLHNNEFGTRAIIHHDQYGFNNPPEAWNRPEIVILGPSTVYGYGVDRRKNFVDLLRTQHGYRILNLGFPSVRGGIPRRNLGIIREYLGTIQPSTVIWAVAGQISGENSQWSAKFPGPDYDDINYSQRLVERQSEVDLFLREGFEEKEDRQFTIGSEQSHLSDFLRLRNLRTHLSKLIREALSFWQHAESNAPNSYCHPEIVSHHLSSIEKASLVLRKKAVSNFIVLFAPEKERLSGQYKEMDYCYATLVYETRKKGYPVIDLLDIMRENNISDSDIYEFNGSMHFSPNGHQLVADLLAPALKKIHETGK